jgi:5'-nucleotidase
MTPLILLTNDDGIHAPGIRALEKGLDGLGEIWTVAPHVERSACGRAVSLRRPLRVHEMGERRLAVDGTPADCVLLAYRKLLPRPADVVVSGINHGHNIGEDLDYSGTVGAAAEAALHGAPTALAISVSATSNSDTFAHAAAVCRSLLKELLPHPLPPHCYLNINLPDQASRRIRWTRPGNPLGLGDVTERIDPRGTRYFWIGNRPDESSPLPCSAWNEAIAAIGDRPI